MADTVTLEEMEVAAAQLSPTQRLELAERIQAQLKQTTPGVRIKYPKQSLPIDEYIALCNEVAALTRSPSFHQVPCKLSVSGMMNSGKKGVRI